MVYTTLTVQNFRDRTGIDLQTKYPNPTDAQRVIDDATQTVMDYVDANDLYFDQTDVTEAQNEILNRAVIFQIKYVLANGDLSSLSGMDPISGTIIDQGRLARLAMSQQARQLLDGRLINRMY